MMDREDKHDPQDELRWTPPTPPPPPHRAANAHPLVTAVLSIALVIALAAAALLGVRVRKDRRDLDALRAQVAAQESEAAQLRGQLGAGGTDPISSLERAVERLRGLTFEKQVKAEILSPAKFKDRVHSELLAGSSKAEILSSQKVLRTYGVIPDTLDLYQTFVSVQEEQIGGFYDSKSKRLVIPAEDAQAPSPYDREVLAHELTHALTDQHFDLAGLDKLKQSDRDDHAAAFVALAEGDAEAVRMLYETEVLTADEQKRLGDIVASSSVDRFTAAPKFLQDLFIFPYLQGTDFVRTLRDRGGFDLVNQAYKDPPTSTEQILHPAKYLDARDDPSVVQMPDVAASLGTGWKKIQTGEVGEFDLRLIGDYGGEGLPFAEARTAAAGWDGGRYVGVDSAQGTVVATLTTWDSVAEAREAARSFGRWLPLRYRNEGSSFAAGTDAQGWNSKKGSGEVIRRGTQMLILLGPAEDVLQRARAAFPGF